MKLPSTLALVLAACALGGAAQAQEARLRVVDVGAGLCVIGSFPGGYDFLYDAGHWTGGHCRAAARELVTDRQIELVALSHSDADHLGDLAGILEDHRAGVILHTGSVRDTGTWRAAYQAIGREAVEGATVVSLSTWPVAPGTTFQMGGAQVTFVFGLSEWDHALSDPGRAPNAAEARNAISIVMRVTYGEHSVLLTGDSIGRRIGDPAGACRDAERAMVRSQDRAPLQSDILIAAHHGGDNGSAACFIEAVDPQYVIFSAGHDHEHPRASTAERFLAQGVPESRIFRTDRRDDEGNAEWPVGRAPGCSDRPGDDAIEVRMRRRSPLEVRYLANTPQC